MGAGAVAVAFVAGVLTNLSPCVLPILPIVLGAAASERKYGPAALAAGLAVSFVAVELFVATIGFSIGLTADLFRQVGAALLVIFGAVLMLPRMQERLAMASGPIVNWTDRRFGGHIGSGYAGQFGVGVLLGAVWSPCVGPTLGAASLWPHRAAICRRSPPACWCLGLARHCLCWSSVWFRAKRCNAGATKSYPSAKA